jgi:hypothetical protein
MGRRPTRSDHSGKVVLEEVEEEGQQLEFLRSTNSQPTLQVVRGGRESTRLLIPA